jgi:hypothetical protein
MFHEPQFVLLLLYSAKLVDAALASGSIFKGEGFRYVKECFRHGTLHFIGLLSDGGVHSRYDQLEVYLYPLPVLAYISGMVIPTRAF